MYWKDYSKNYTSNRSNPSKWSNVGRSDNFGTLKKHIRKNKGIIKLVLSRIKYGRLSKRLI